MISIRTEVPLEIATVEVALEEDHEFVDITNPGQINVSYEWYAAKDRRNCKKLSCIAVSFLVILAVSSFMMSQTSKNVALGYCGGFGLLLGTTIGYCWANSLCKSKSRNARAVAGLKALQTNAHFLDYLKRTYPGSTTLSGVAIGEKYAIYHRERKAGS